MVFDLHMQIYISIQVGRSLYIKPCVSVTPHINNHDYVGRPLDIKPCVPVTSYINKHDYVGRPLDIKPCVSVTPHINNQDYMETEIEKGNYTFMKEYLPEIREKVNELERLQKLNESQAKQILSLQNIKDIPKMMNFWKGLPNYETFYALYHFSQTRAKHLRYWKGQCPGNLDCTEIFVQNPSKLDARKQVYLNNKHHDTFKFLVGVSQQMGIREQNV